MDIVTQVIMQVAGSMGLIETVVEFTYVLTNTANFTSFEKVFFLTSGVFEMASELFFLLGALLTFAVHSRGSEERCSGAKVLTKDPIHNLATVAFEDMVGNLTDEQNRHQMSSIYAIMMSVLSLLLWATFLPVWANWFDGDGDDGVRLALSICSVCLISGISIGLCAENKLLFGTTLCGAYAAGKTFEVYILLSDLDRLCPGKLGEYLVAFQVIEILSVVVILCCIWVKTLRRGPAVG